MPEFGSRARVERDQLVTRRHVQDPRVVAALPVREPATGELARRGFFDGPVDGLYGARTDAAIRELIEKELVAQW